MSDGDGPTRRWAREVLDFWFSKGPNLWWRGSAEFDAEIRELFEALWDSERERQVIDFLQTPEDALAAILLFDQFPRNMFRGSAEQFATDHIALAIAKNAVDLDFDHELDKDQRTFLYMPFEHSEDHKDQLQSLLLFTALGDDELLGYARKHHDVIERFGRFPHRNAMLGRKPTAMELAAGDVVPW